jgi:O-methyltransferase
MGDDRYINLLKLVLTDYHRFTGVEYFRLSSLNSTLFKNFLRVLNVGFEKVGYELLRSFPTSRESRINGLDWPGNADTMIGLKRLDNIEFCVREIIRNNIEGDFIETGVWRGGAVIFMKAMLEYLDDKTKKVFVADSFQGLPKPDIKKYKSDFGDKHHTWSQLSIGVEVVKENFKKYNLLDERVVFLEGWFADTLVDAPIEKLSLIRLDGDMYGSTMDAIQPLYPKLSKGGFVIVDDYFAVKGCQLAILDYRKELNITEEMIPIDQSAVYWQKTTD